MAERDRLALMPVAMRGHAGRARTRSARVRRAATPLRWLVLLTALTLALAAQPLLAHRGHAVWTDIHWAEDRFEIVHRMHLADAITVSRFMGSEHPIEDLRSLARVALYAEQRFRIADSGDGAAAVSLQTLGAEIEDDFILIYQEWIAPLPERFPAIDNQMLLDVEPDAQALIKIKAPGLSEERMR